MKQRIRFIINPISGVGRKGELPGMIEQYLDQSKFEYDIVYTEYRKHAKLIAAESSDEGIDIVCAVGGDGSVHEVGTALIGRTTRLAIIPTGSGNGLARHLGIPVNIPLAIACINNSNFIEMDTVMVNDKPFLGIGGYGFDAVIAKKFDEYHKRGFWSYVKLVCREFWKYNPVNISIDMNGEIKQMPVVLCTIANSSEFGNGFVVSPKSDVTDGKLEMVILKPFRFWSIPSLVVRFFRKTSHKSKFTEVISFQNAKIRIPHKIAHYDGEPFDVRQELNVRVVPKSLHILVGKK
ncbi:MAG: diacylglycerol/lipid kinase family protein [Bacteroidota bacterium]